MWARRPRLAQSLGFRSERSVGSETAQRQWAQMPETQRLAGRLADDGFVPKCKVCQHGVLKADVTFFGEALPAGAMTRALAAVMASPLAVPRAP